jgi:hypothetical protein
MPKYKISKSNLKEFFGLFGRSKEDRQAKINQLIDNDPVLKKLDKANTTVSLIAHCCKITIVYPTPHQTASKLFILRVSTSNTLS